MVSLSPSRGMVAKLAIAAVAACSLVGYRLVVSSGEVPSVPLAGAAQVDYFLKIEGIEGESRDERHKGEIEIESFSWGVSQLGTAATGGGGGAGKASFQDFHFTKTTDKSSPLLFKSVPSGKHYPTAILIGRRAGESQQEFLKVTLSDVLVSSYSQAGDAGGAAEEFTLKYGAIVHSYTPQGADGKPQAPVSAGWDLKANKGL